MEQKGCESIGHYVTFSYDLDLGLPRSSCEIAVSQEWEGRLAWKERGVR